MTQVNFITEDIMLRNTYLYENRMFTNKVNCSIVYGGETQGRENKRIFFLSRAVKKLRPTGGRNE